MFDWGGFFGLRIAAENPDIFCKLVLLNTQLPTGEPSAGHEWFIQWRGVQLALPIFPQGEMVQEGTVKELSSEIVSAYDAPYPDQSYRTGPRRFPMILPISPDSPAREANLAAWETLANWDKPVLTLFSKQFEGSAMGPTTLLTHIPGCKNQAHALIDEASFYIVEDQSHKLCDHLLKFAS
ncbi:MAG: haloalkane dehalogenase, partial [Gammaproteobacteria bacterium]|nr:haloalkane dehalogenase [Gammaproteobacteria bacterium]